MKTVPYLRVGTSYYKLVQAQQNIEALSPLEIGKKHRGGIIFYIDNTGQHGLITAEENLGEYTWEDALSKCNSLRLNGFSDWRLPTKEELDMLYRKKDKIGGFDSNWYWSSLESEHSNIHAWMQRFLNGKQIGYHKGFKYAVRAVRAF